MKRASVVLIVLVAACGTQDSTEPMGESAAALTASAALSLTTSDATLAQTSDATWRLTKTGEFDPVLRTITWSITTAQGSSAVNHLVVNGTMARSDTLDDITKISTATFSNAQCNLGATSGMVTVSWDGGASGGTIANCAHLTASGVMGVDLTACDTQTIAATRTCTPGAAGCRWQQDYILTSKHNRVGRSELGCCGAVGRELRRDLSGRARVRHPRLGRLLGDVLSTAAMAYLPAVGVVGKGTGDLLDPSSSSAGSSAVT